CLITRSSSPVDCSSKVCVRTSPCMHFPKFFESLPNSYVSFALEFGSGSCTSGSPPFFAWRSAVAFSFVLASAAGFGIAVLSALEFEALSAGAPVGWGDEPFEDASFGEVAPWLPPSFAWADGAAGEAAGAADGAAPSFEATADASPAFDGEAAGAAADV